LIFKVSNAAIAPVNQNNTPGPVADGYCIRISNVPVNVSTAQVILLFTHTVKKHIDKLQKYEFDFTELCPIGMPQLR
jgi:hypothetical protein